MPGTLYVVATPIGNLEDVTLRALRILREVSLIAAEDTRRTARLLQHYSISTPTTSLHEHNEGLRGPRLFSSGCRRANPLRWCRMRARRSSRIRGRRSGRRRPCGRDSRRADPRGRRQPWPRSRPPDFQLKSSCSSGSRQLGVTPENRGSMRWRTSQNGHLLRSPAPDQADACRTFSTSLGDRTAAIGRELTKVHEELVVRPISEHLEAHGRADAGSSPWSCSREPGSEYWSIDLF